MVSCWSRSSIRLFTAPIFPHARRKPPFADSRQKHKGQKAEIAFVTTLRSHGRLDVIVTQVQMAEPYLLRRLFASALQELKVWMMVDILTRIAPPNHIGGVHKRRSGESGQRGRKVKVSTVNSYRATKDQPVLQFCAKKPV